MAYTLPVDSVPLLGAGLVTELLIVIVQFSKSYAERLSARPRTRPFPRSA